MTRDEIYDHLAQVYLGKRNRSAHQNDEPIFNRYVFGKLAFIVIVCIGILLLTAFLSIKYTGTDSNVIFSLTNSPLRISYDLRDPYPQMTHLSVPLPKINVGKYKKLCFSIRGTEEGCPGIVKVVIKNKKNEAAAHFVYNVGLRWQKIVVPLSAFSSISDWDTIADISFVLEAWNVEKKKGTVLIDDLRFAG